MKQFFELPIYFYSYVLAVFVVARLPYIGAFVRVFNTLVHEGAHALVAILTSGKIFKIELQSNTSGSTLSASKNKFCQFLIAISGYPLAAATAYGLFYFLINGFGSEILIGIIIFTSILLLLFIRNTFGIIWAIIFIGLISFVLYLDNPKIIDFSVMTLAFILATEALFSTLMLLLIALESPSDSGDAKILSSITMLPAIFWALVFVATNGIIVYQIVVNLLIT